MVGAAGAGTREARVARIWGELAAICGTGCGSETVVGVDVAGVADEDRLLLDRVAILSVLRTWVNGVLVVQTTADGVALDDLVAHPG